MAHTPALARNDLRPGQLATIDELKASTGVQAVLGMGAGKTACALTAIADLLGDGTIRAAIVMAPKLVAHDVWSREHLKWAHLAGLDVAVLSGSPARRAALLAGRHDVYVVTTDLTGWLVEQLETLPREDPRLDLLVIDELSRFKSPRGTRAKALLDFAARFAAIWGMSGTPRPNDEQDQWMQLQVVSAGEAFAQSFDAWRRANFMPQDYQGFSWKIHDFARDNLARVVDAWSFTVPRTDESDVPFNHGDDLDIFVDLPAEALRDLKTLEKKLLVELGGKHDSIAEVLTDEEALFAFSKATAAGKMMQVMQGFIYEEGETVLRYRTQAKVDAVKAAVAGLSGDPVLVPYHYREDLAALRGAFGAALPHLGHEVSPTAARAIVDRWNAGEIPVLAVHPASAGHGLNLQHGGRRLIWFHPTWSAEYYAQTVKRLARPGQKYPVFSHRIRARHWYEDLRVNRVMGKLREQQDFIDGMRTLA